MKVGKIGRLPRELREQVNRRLQNDEPTASLLEWLNSLPEVKSLLAAEFGGCPVSKQNLSEWRQHGYRQWQMRQAALEFRRNLACLLLLSSRRAGGRRSCGQAPSQTQSNLVKLTFLYPSQRLDFCPHHRAVEFAL